MAISTDKKCINQLVQLCAKKDITDVVICPGSRDAALIIAFQSQNEFQLHHIVDERSAGFFALGLALQSHKTVALVCSSGSAVLNFAPAISEAFHQGVPLLVLTADRPKYWTGQMVGQTINQTEVFKNIVKKSYELPLHQEERDLYFSNRMSNEAINVTQAGKQGPVHINIPVEEPLYNTTEEIVDARVIHYEEVNSVMSSTQFESCVDIWNKSKKKMILIGQMSKSERFEQQLNQLLNDASVVVLVENISNLQLQKGLHCIDRSLESITENVEAYQPDLLITFGGAVVSKKIKSFLRAANIQSHWNFTQEEHLVDTYGKLTHQFNSDPIHFVEKLNGASLETKVENYQAIWKQKDFQNLDQQEDFMESLPFCDLKVFYKINQWIPENVVLHLGNSSVVRYSQLFNPIKNVSYQGNRGVSGIDGSTSTAFGFAHYSQKQNIFISGDLSFLYDSNALWLNPPKNLKIILINNGGGGIFKIIPGPKTTGVMEKAFVTEHSKTFQSLIESHQMQYSSIDSESDIDAVLDHFLYRTEGFAILEVNTQNIENEKFLHKYFNELKK